jgi:hypothetical protein
VGTWIEAHAIVCVEVHTMESRPPVTPLPPHRGRHAGIVSTGLLIATTVVVWITHEGGPSKAPVGPTPAVAAVSHVLESQLASIELGSDVATVVVAEREIPRVVAATGAVTLDASRTNHVRTPVTGLFVKTRPSSLGRTVRVGETVGVVYSFEVTSRRSSDRELRDFRGQEHVDRARVRLLRWGMRREQLARIEQSMTPSAALPMIARLTGKVVDEAEGGQRQLIDAFDDLMTITDPTYAAIYVDVPSADADRLRVGQVTRVQLGTSPAIAAPIGYSPVGDARIVRATARSAEDALTSTESSSPGDGDGAAVPVRRRPQR